MEIGDRKLIQKAVRVVEVRFGFCWKTNDDVDANACVGHGRFDRGHAAGIEVAFIAAAHLAQYVIVAALQRHVEVWHEPRRLGHKGNDLVGQQIRLNR